MQISTDKVVTIDYVLTGDDGQEIDRSTADAPLTYLHGHGNLLAGLENALAGKGVSDSITVALAPAEGYGEYDQSLVQAVSRDMFQGVDELEVGMQFQASTAEGMAQVIAVTAVEGDQVTIDANHPLAGVHLNFKVDVVAVREATEEELAHGHCHGSCGCEGESENTDETGCGSEGCHCT